MGPKSTVELERRRAAIKRLLLCSGGLSLLHMQFLTELPCKQLLEEEKLDYACRVDFLEGIFEANGTVYVLYILFMEMRGRKNKFFYVFRTTVQGCAKSMFLVLPNNSFFA